MAGDFDTLFSDGPDSVTEMGVLEIHPEGWGFLRRDRELAGASGRLRVRVAGSDSQLRFEDRRYHRRAGTPAQRNGAVPCPLAP